MFMNHLRKFAIYLFKLAIRAESLNVLMHNQVDMSNYPDDNWTLVPFPGQKGFIYNADNLATVNRHEFITDPIFVKALSVAEGRWGQAGEVRDIRWRLHVALWAFGLALSRSSNSHLFLELGTGKGYMAAAICDKYFSSPTSSPFLYLFDCFEMHLNVGNNIVPSPASFAYSDGSKPIIDYFSKFNNVIVVAGLLPETLNQLPRASISFLHVDLNSKDTEEACLNHLVSQFEAGTVILFDDYGGPFGSDQAEMHDHFAENHGKEILSLPTGQGLLIW
jgi:O-methyltransferase